MDTKELRERWLKLSQWQDGTDKPIPTDVELVDSIIADIEAQGWRVVPGWQPIETAPKDGTPVDLWFGADEFPHRVTDAKWCKPEHTCHSQYCDTCPDDPDKLAWRDAITGYEHEIGRPTHWRMIDVPSGAAPQGEKR